MQPNQPPAPGQPQTPPPLSQDLASLANILTQIQYDLMDISIQLTQPPNPEKPFNSRLDDKAVSWIQDLINKISKQLPKHQDPILPVGSQLACEFYYAKSLAHRTLTELSLFYDQHEAAKPKNYKQINDYLQQLMNLMFAIFRWSNLIMGEKEWFWKSKDQMPNQGQQQTQNNQPQSTANQPLPVNQPNTPAQQSPGLLKN